MVNLLLLLLVITAVVLIVCFRFSGSVRLFLVLLVLDLFTNMMLLSFSVGPPAVSPALCVSPRSLCVK